MVCIQKGLTKKIGFFLTFFLFICKINGQDLHYSQFYNTPQNINPALTGVFGGDHRFVASLRDQWRFVPVPWTTFSAAYDRKLYVLKGNKHFIGAGANLNHDRQGDSPLTLTSLNINAAYHRILTPEHIVSGGLALGLASRGFNSQTLTWDKQWNGDAFDPSIGSGEAFGNFERVTFLETGLGVNYRYQKSKRSYGDVGFSALHLVKPNTSFVNSNVARLPQRFTYSLVGNLMVADILDVQLHALHQVQDEYQETVFGALGKIYLSQAKGKEFQLHVGAGYRTAGSLFPTAAIQYNNIYASFSYDIDRTQYNAITQSNRGGPEIHVRYVIVNVKPIKEVKVCPIY